MRCNLRDLNQKIEKYFKEYVWMTKPPMKEADMKLALLSYKMYDTNDYLTNCDDEEYVEAIDELKSYICKEFNIPPTEDELKEWLKEDSIRHSLIIDLYNHL